jgi:RNA polymerase sigma-70 factor (ECF subfamily)
MVNYHPQDTEDVCSIIWIKAYDKLDRFNRKKKFFSWLYTIARNTCFDHLRKKRMTVVSLDDMSGFENTSIQLEDAVVNRHLLQNTLGKLSLQHKNLLILRYIEGYQPKDISTILGIPVNRVSVQLNRAIKQAKKLLSQ